VGGIDVRAVGWISQPGIDVDREISPDVPDRRPARGAPRAARQSRPARGVMRVPGLPNLSIRTKLIVIVAGTLLLAQAISAILIREIVSRHILQQAITTVDILTTSIQHDITYE